jgi:hypothetical protein
VLERTTLTGWHFASQMTLGVHQMTLLYGMLRFQQNVLQVKCCIVLCRCHSTRAVCSAVQVSCPSQNSGPRTLNSQLCTCGKTLHRYQPPVTCPDGAILLLLFPHRTDLLLLDILRVYSLVCCLCSSGGSTSERSFGTRVVQLKYPQQPGGTHTSSPPVCPTWLPSLQHPWTTQDRC